MPTALDAGWYNSKGFHVRRHRQYVRATGLLPPSTWASAARSSGVITAVECSLKSGPYCRHVSGGVFRRTPSSGKKTSVGLPIAWYTQLTADQTTRMTSATARTRTAIGAAANARNARRNDRTRRRIAIRPERIRFFRRADRAARECGTEAMSITITEKDALDFSLISLW